MTKGQLLAVAAAISALAAGTVVFLTQNSADSSIDGTTAAPTMFQLVDRSTCSVAACNSTQCTQAKNVLNDAGSPCTVGFADCSARVGPVARNIAADAGLVFGPALYQRVRFVGMRCPVAGGFTYAIPVDDAGWPVFALQTTTPLCVRAPLDGGTNCLRQGLLPDGGAGFFGTGNVFPSALSAGSNCDQVECTVVYGDDPDQSL